MNLENTKPEKQPKTRTHIKRILIWLAIIFIVSIALLYLNNLFFWLTGQQNFIPVYTFDVFNKTLLFSLSVLTILLLYLNYELQKEELKKLNEANKELVEGNKAMVEANIEIVESNNTANTNQILLNEKQSIDNILMKLSTDNKSQFNNFNSTTNKLLLELGGDNYSNFYSNIGNLNRFYAPEIDPALIQINNIIHNISIILNDHTNFNIFKNSFSPNLSSLIINLHKCKFPNEEHIPPIASKVSMETAVRILKQLENLKKNTRDIYKILTH